MMSYRPLITNHILQQFLLHTYIRVPTSQNYPTLTLPNQTQHLPVVKPLFIFFYVHNSTSNSFLTTMSYSQKSTTKQKMRNRSRRNSINSRNFCNQLQGRLEVLSKWLFNSPLVDSHVEEENPGTAKKTRTNTLVNRDSAFSLYYLSQYDSFNQRFRSSAQGHYHSVPALPTLRRRKVSFASVAHEFSYENPHISREVPIKEQNGYPLEVRNRKFQHSSSLFTDPSNPITPRPIWLQRRQSVPAGKFSKGMKA